MSRYRGGESSPNAEARAEAIFFRSAPPGSGWDIRSCNSFI